MNRNLELGRLGEDLTVEYLQQHGYEVLDRNWRCKMGEIDIVAREIGQLACIEVKTRRSLRSGHPFESITPEKLARMRRLAGQWAASNPEIAGSVRVDAVSVIIARGSAPAIVHLQDIG
ncbi:MAG: YraN family protein [Gulosibacter sp.]|uniref:YraN family protein n=1 Tax=Gulosibacter sp. TaxID=2817531 RepID=UPI003F90B3A5